MEVAVMAEIRGIGVDLVEVERVKGALLRHPALIHRLFTEQEAVDAGQGPQRYPRLAARLAAKEAVSKALGTGISGFSWREIEVRRAPGGRPEAYLSGGAQDQADRLGVRRIFLSLTHTRGYALAEAVLEA